jgi:octaprenyl-diphosphate synthase
MSLRDFERIKLITLQKRIASAMSRFEEEFAAAASGDTPLTREICAHILKGRSKRFRPTLLLLSAKSRNGLDPRSITAAVGVELVHTATLLHDDFIDGALTRRGQASVNVAWGESAALIMGDYLYGRSLEILCRSGLDEAVRLLSSSTVLMSEAEMLQLELRYDSGISEEQYHRIIHQKTASLIETSCHIGASLNPDAATSAEAFAHFGRKIGLVFQITDDIFDYLGDERRLGKPTGQDWEEGRITLPLIAALRAAPPGARERLTALSAERDGAARARSWPEVKTFVMDHGGVDYAFSRARQYGEEAKEALAPVASGTQKDLLAVAVEYVINRLN